ncbi:alpha/beta fold hydrolase [Streptococcus sp. sy018]|uniref:alpha/beta fold hydrolase n=1 Tax=Streptococcus sp. sy018 TaxID=2600147 RepID=UPI0011B555FB|nr:alpha/beta hydrolase [Streptococcus sp. sy018]TWS95238.1 alpha/beta hydrolase [Streptococcus sp. sy018]
MGYLRTKNQYVMVSGQKMAYRRVGQGKSKLPLVMLIHLAATLDNWDPKLIDLLAEKQEIILLDLPGVGGSQGKVGKTIPAMAEQAIAIIKALGYQKINLLGLSMGGMIAQEIIRLDQNLVEKLILAGTGHRGGLELDKVTEKTFKYMLKAGVERVDPKRYIFYNHDAKGAEEAKQVLTRMAAREADFMDGKMAVPSFLQQLKAIKSWGKELVDDLAHITQPTLVVNGDNDMQVPTSNSYEMAKKLTNSQLIIYPEAGHGSIFQYAEQFSKDLLTFLDERR